jgi:preprotein translocase subunit SecE
MIEDVRNETADTADKLKLGAAIALVLAGLAAFYGLGNEVEWIRWLAVVVGLVLAVVMLGASSYGRTFRQFVLDARGELRKIVWPTFEETRNTTAVVFGFVIISGLFFWGLDVVLAWATRALTGQGG